ncbi:VCBS domain-containing protein [Niveibacterium sp. SC-1]|uniref:VCBS domain-containing protein n=1 Tax=Niveibacterium sp. SC-1 TaxID=3135646 RepID=UPI00311D6CEE
MASRSQLDRAAQTALLRPGALAMALEPRILFDGAAATAVEQHASAPAAATPTVPTTGAAPQPTETRTNAAPRDLVVIDSRVSQIDTLLRNVSSDARTVVLGSNDDALAKISSALADMGQAASVQILSHGSAGQIELGNRSYSADTLREAAAALQAWKSHLAEGADIDLYGCKVGAGEAGRALVAELARTTGADVAASDDDTGSARLGGNWTLEVRQGLIDRSLALQAEGLAAYDALMANANPVTGFDQAGSNALLGSQFTFTVSLSNASSQDGYAPFVDLFLPATGKDGDDGVSFVAATYFGQTLSTQVVTFDANGKATHPLAKDSSGNALVIDAATYGMRAGDQLVVVRLPYAAVNSSQPVVSIQVTAVMSDLADTSLSDGSPDLVIKARGGFQYGNDTYDNPTTDPSIVEAGVHSYAVHPTLVTLTQSIDVREGETATGPNYPHTQTVSVTPGPGQVLTNVDVVQDLPDNIQVTAIIPGAGGTLTSVTLADGRVLTNATAIDLAIASDTLFITRYTVHYASLSGATDQQVRFYVPEHSANGQPVLDPQTGNSVVINFAGPSATGSWTPIDPRDVVAPATSIDFSASGDGLNGSLTAKSITLEKNAEIETDIGTRGLSPGDTLRYTLDVALSDYFGFGKTLLNQGQFTITDTVGDGQTLTGTPTLSFTANGAGFTVAAVYTASTDAAGVTTISVDIAATLLTLPQRLIGALAGDLAIDDVLQGATQAHLQYSTTVGQSYTTPYPPHSDINEGDTLTNAATLAATVLQDRTNLTGFSQNDNSSTQTTVPTDNVDVELLSVNNGAPPANGELRPGDVVTFRLSYDLVTGDYEQLKLTAYLPLPLFNLGPTGTIWQSGSQSGEWALGSGNTNADPTVTVRTIAGNALEFDFGDYATAITTGSRIEVQFTLTVSDQPFADKRAETILAQSSQQTTITDQLLISTDATAIASVAEPLLSVTHGVVSATHGTTDVTGWSQPGTSGQPFPGTLTDPQSIVGDVRDMDGGDRLRLATAIENLGGGSAFDVTTQVTLPAGLNFTGGSLAAANLLIYRGDGTQLVAGQDYSVSGNVVTFLDHNGIATLTGGRSGSAADLAGSNLIVITYDVVVGNSLVDNSIEASRNLASSVSLSRYASVDGGANFLSADLTAQAREQVAAPVITKTFAGGSLDDSDSSASHTTGSDLVVGESMTYDIVVTLPEGTTRDLRIDDLIPAGMKLDTSFNGNQGYQLITTAGGALVADFGGTVSLTLSAPSGNLGDDGADARFTFTANTTTADNQTNNNSFVIRVRLVADNVSANQSGTTLQNDATLTYTDPDGDTDNGSSSVSRDVALSSGRPTITVQEPTLQISQTLITDPGLGFDENDPIEFSITLRNGTGSSDFSAFDILLQDTLPSQLGNFSLASVTYQGGATNHGGPDFELVQVGSQFVLRTASGANVDIAKGGSIELRVTAIVNASAASVPQFNNVSEVRWTSLDGSSNTTADPAGERTGADGLLGSGVLNDYARNSTLTIPVAQGIKVSRVGGMADTAAPDPTNAAEETAAIGEIVHYRAVALIPDGFNPNYEIHLVLDRGLTLADLASMRIAFVSNGGLVSDATLVTAGQLAISGNENSPVAQYLAPDLSGAAATGVLDPSRVTVVTDPSTGIQTVTISLGNITNGGSDALDNDREGIVLEFNARLSNETANQSGARPGVTVSDQVNGLLRATSDTLYERVVEPGFSGVNKQVTDFDPNPSGTTGSATVSLSFTQNGGTPAYDVSLTDSFAGGSQYTFVAIEINGVRYTSAAAVPARLGFTINVAGGIAAGFAQIAQGDAITLIYSVSVPNASAIASSDATLSWSSLPESFTSWGGSTVGADGTAAGERTGADGGGGLNDYVLKEGAGLGRISGNLWNDTASATGSATPDGPGLAGQTVTLTWAGLDGDINTTADNKTFTTTTDASGAYSFGVLAAGTYRIGAPLAIDTPQPQGGLRVRIDTDGATLGSIDVALGEGASSAAHAGYVEQNDAPTVTLPDSVTGDEDTVIALTGISVADVDAERDPNATDRIVEVHLSVGAGTLWLDSTPAGVTSSTQHLDSLTLQGRVADLNLALTQLRYQAIANFNGQDRLGVVVNDLGNFGDADGNGIPGEAGDALTASGSATIIVRPVNDAPVANDDNTVAVEAGGKNNDEAGIDPQGSLLANDTDVDMDPTLNGNIDQLHVISAGLDGSPQTSIANGTVLQITGLYGTLFVSSGGGARYEVDNSNTTVQQLRSSGDTLTERFAYTIADTANATSSAVLTVTIEGADDAPVGQDTAGTAIEAGGVANGTPGADATGNVLDAATDVDTHGESLSITHARLGDEFHYDNAAVVPPASDWSTGAVVTGLYGSLHIGADGTYHYVVDNNNATVQGLSPNQTLQELFSYEITDLAGQHDLAQLTITIQGAADNPVASDDLAQAQAAIAEGQQGESNPSGNVITLASRPNDTDNGIDTDVDANDRLPGALTVSGIRTGTEAAASALTPLGGSLVQIDADYATHGGVPVASGQPFGRLSIAPDGSFHFDVNSDNPQVQALAASDYLEVVFTYEITDTAGKTDLAQLVVQVFGVNNPPVAQTTLAVATESGGDANASPGIDPTGNVLVSAVDPEGDALSVTGIRTGPESGTGASGTVGQALRGLYGDLTLNADGSYTYVLDNTLAAVEALRTGGDRLVERFTYTISDNNVSVPQSDSAEIVVVIRGQDDTPVAGDDSATAQEAGGRNNGTPGISPSGNVLDNDSDADGGDVPADLPQYDYGETRTVVSVRTGTETGSGTAGTLGTELRGNYGWLQLQADGSYVYRVDDSMAAVQQLRTSAQTLVDDFSYEVADTAGSRDRATLSVTLRGANDAPVANADTATAIEAGGSANGTPGTDPSGNVLSNDTDVDAGEALSVMQVSQGARTATPGNALSGQYGSLLLQADGSYTYQVDNSNTVVQSLRLNTDTLTETFTYEISDIAGARSVATLTVVIRGRDDSPVASNDLALATEAGGTLNAQPGVNPSGNLLTNDNDVDGADTRQVDGIRTGDEAQGGSFSVVSGPQTLAGLYGTLTVKTDGSYSYEVNNDLAAVQALRPGDTLNDLFTYRMRDTAGASDTAELRVVVRGAWDAPVATNNIGYAVAQSELSPGRDAVGRLLDPEATIAADSDVDRGDIFPLNGIRYGPEIAAGPFANVTANTNSGDGTLFVGVYGVLVVGADGSYVYRADPSNPVVQALGPRDFVTETFTYRIRDEGGLTDTAELTIIVRGQNSAPVAGNDTALAVEAGGVANTTPGQDPAGNVLGNDSDVEADALAITAIRTGRESGTGTDGQIANALRGQYGTLTMGADGNWSYVLDNALPEVEALRTAGQTLTDFFTYTVEDIYGASDQAELRVVISGRNDTPTGTNDAAVAIEAGGTANRTPGLDPQGNVLANDLDVDGVAYGETHAVLSVANDSGVIAAAGEALQGRYGSLMLNVDGSYQYIVDNSNPAVQALRTAGEVLHESFTYQFSDQAGAIASATLAIEIHGADDAPVAVDDQAIATDLHPAPHASGAVLPNDSDVDGGDALVVSGIRAGNESGSGAAGVVGEALNGRYGTLTIGADGHYTYQIDLTNPEVIAASGLGLVLQDVFTYTVTDRAGLADTAELRLDLVISAPPNPEGTPDPHWGSNPFFTSGSAPLPDVDPALFVTPVVGRNAIVAQVSGLRADGSQIAWLLTPENTSESIGAGLGQVEGQFVGHAIRAGQLENDVSLAHLKGRAGRIDLSADGLLPSPSLFPALPEHMLEGFHSEAPEPPARTAEAFSRQIANAAQRRALAPMTTKGVAG